MKLKTTIKEYYFLFFLFLTLLLQSGCSNKIGLSGKVTFEDGKPLETGTVCFETSNYMARGIIQSDGTYTVSSVSKNDGIPPGNYQVYIVGAEKETGKNKTGEPIIEPLIDSKFNDKDSSGLSIDVTNSTKTFNITVIPYVSKKK